MKAITQHYYGTTEEWQKYNPVIYNAVFAFEIITRPDGSIYRKIKAGDGKRRWNELPYIMDESKLNTLDEIQQRLKVLEKIVEIYTGEVL